MTYSEIRQSIEADAKATSLIAKLGKPTGSKMNDNGSTTIIFWRELVKSPGRTPADLYVSCVETKKVQIVVATKNPATNQFESFPWTESTLNSDSKGFHNEEDRRISGPESTPSNANAAASPKASTDATHVEFRRHDGSEKGIVIGVTGPFRFTVMNDAKEKIEVPNIGGHFRVLPVGIWADAQASLTNEEAYIKRTPRNISVNYGATFRSSTDLDQCYSVLQWTINNTPAWACIAGIGNVKANRPYWVSLYRPLDDTELGGTYSIHIYSGVKEVACSQSTKDKYWPERGESNNDVSVQNINARIRQLQSQVNALHGELNQLRNPNPKTSSNAFSICERIKDTERELSKAIRERDTALGK